MLFNDLFDNRLLNRTILTVFLIFAIFFLKFLQPLTSKWHRIEIIDRILFILVFFAEWADFIIGQISIFFILWFLRIWTLTLFIVQYLIFTPGTDAHNWIWTTLLGLRILAFTFTTLLFLLLGGYFLFFSFFFFLFLFLPLFIKSFEFATHVVIMSIFEIRRILVFIFFLFFCLGENIFFDFFNWFWSYIQNMKVFDLRLVSSDICIISFDALLITQPPRMDNFTFVGSYPP